MDTTTSNATEEFVGVMDRPENLAEASGLQPNGATAHLSVDNAPTAPHQSKKKVNPLVDLIETEKAYVDLLAAIIRKVAAAWSRSNFPPPQLDAMFRSIEVVYRANRSLLVVNSLLYVLPELLFNDIICISQKLNEIGPNPTSPKALGDLLMRWVCLGSFALALILIIEAD